jgi:hypothetical protein
MDNLDGITHIPVAPAPRESTDDGGILMLCNATVPTARAAHREATEARAVAGLTASAYPGDDYFAPEYG